MRKNAAKLIDLSGLGEFALETEENNMVLAWGDSIRLVLSREQIGDLLDLLDDDEDDDDEDECDDDDEEDDDEEDDESAAWN